VLFKGIPIHFGCFYSPGHQIIQQHIDAEKNRSYEEDFSCHRGSDGKILHDLWGFERHPNAGKKNHGQTDPHVVLGKELMLFVKLAKKFRWELTWSKVSIRCKVFGGATGDWNASRGLSSIELDMVSLFFQFLWPILGYWIRLWESCNRTTSIEAFTIIFMAS